MGYSFKEVGLGDVRSKLEPKSVKKSLKITGCNTDETRARERVPISRTLCVYCRTATEPIPDPNCQESVVLGIVGRFGAKTPEPSKILLEVVKSFTLRWCENSLDQLQGGDADFDRWLEAAPYTAERKEELKRVWSECPVEDPKLVKDSELVKSFIKDETYSGKFALPRGINSRSDWFKCFSGPVFDAIGKLFFYNTSEMIKTVPVLDRPEDILENIYDTFSQIALCDATSYEAHFSEEVMSAIEFVLYRYMTANVPEYERRMEAIIKTLSGKQKLRFKHLLVEIRATRMSGEMNTSLGNGFTTLILIRVLEWLKQVLAKLRAEGDDNLSAWQDVLGSVPTREEFEEMGWIMKIERPKNAAVASFCGQVFDPVSRVVVTDPVAQLIRFGWVRKKYVNASRPVLLQLLRSKGLSLAHQYNGCPMLALFGRRMVHLTRNVRIRESIINNMELYKREQFRQYVRSPLPEYVEPSPETRALVSELYGISIQDQLAFEKSVEDIELDMSFELNLPHHPRHTFYYDMYTFPVGEQWKWPTARHDSEVKEAILSLSANTRGFIESYYRL